MNRIQNIATSVVEAGLAVAFALGGTVMILLIAGGVYLLSEAGADTTQALQGWGTVALGFVLAGILGSLIPTNKE